MLAATTAPLSAPTLDVIDQAIADARPGQWWAGICAIDT